MYSGRPRSSAIAPRSRRANFWGCTPRPSMTMSVFGRTWALAEIDWHRPFTTTLDEAKAPNYRWFTDGQLNVSHNCLDVHLRERGAKTAIIFEGEPGDVRKLSYAELHGEVCRFANALKSLGVGLGDRVVIYMPLIPEAVIAMYACARIGAVHSVVFGGFSANAVKDRIEDAGAKLVITADGGWRGGHPVELKRAVDKALGDGCRTVQNVIVYRRMGGDCPMQHGRDLWWHDVASGQSADLRARMGGCRAPAVPALHLRIDRQAQGNPAFQRRVPAQCQVEHEMGVRHQGSGRILVYRRCRLGHRTHLCGLWAVGGGRHRAHVRGCAHLSRRRTILENLPRPRRQHSLHRAHRDSRAHEIGRCHSREIRPPQAALARQRR